MADKTLPWFRLYPEMMNDHKLMIAANILGISKTEIVGMWVSILCIAGSSPIRGSLYVTFLKRYRNTDVTTLLQIDNSFCDKLMQTLLDMDMLILDKSGGYCIKNWDKRQYESDNSTKRVQKWRIKQKEDVTFQKRNSSVSVSDSIISLSTNYLRIWAGATGMLAIPKNDPNVYLAIDQIQTKYKTEEEIIDYLKPYYKKWITLKSKEGKPYSKTNNAWITDYAVAGEMPGGSGTQSKSREVFK